MLSTIKLRQFNGFILLDCLISMFIALTLFASIIFIISNLLTTNLYMTQVSRLNTDLHHVLTQISQDLRRTGFWQQADLGVHAKLNINPYMANGSDINIQPHCILLAYDINIDGIATDNEYFGYRLKNGALQARTAQGSYSCSSADTGWASITDPQSIIITQLDFDISKSYTLSLSGTGTAKPTITLRNIIITLSGHKVGDVNTRQTLTKVVHVYNNLFAT